MKGAPRILGVVNITPDSFSDGGLFLDPGRAAAQARALWEAGAHAVDLGAASSHPAAPPVAPEDEIRRLAPVLERLEGSGIRLSVDSSQAATQRYALERGVRILNDVRGFADAGAHAELAARDCELIVMHAVPAEAPALPCEALLRRIEGFLAERVAALLRAGVHAELAARDCELIVMHAVPAEAPALPCEALLRRIEGFLADRVAALLRAGVARERLILDPGMGLFVGPDPACSLCVLRHLGRLRDALGLPLLIGVSRKSFLGALTERAPGDRPPLERGAATLAAELAAVERGADYIRTHDVRALVDALRVRAAIEGTGATAEPAAYPRPETTP